MAIKINLESVKIPVEIGDLKYEIDVTDEKYETFVGKFDEFLGKAAALYKEKTEDVTEFKTMLSDIYEALLGEGSFDEIYEQMPNISFVSSTFVKIVTQLMQVMGARVIAKPKAKAVFEK